MTFTIHSKLNLEAASSDLSASSRMSTSAKSAVTKIDFIKRWSLLYLDRYYTHNHGKRLAKTNKRKQVINEKDPKLSKRFNSKTDKKCSFSFGNLTFRMCSKQNCFGLIIFDVLYTVVVNSFTTLKSLFCSL